MPIYLLPINQLERLVFKLVINKRQVDAYDIKTDVAGKIRKIILKHGINTEEYPIEYDKNGNLMRIGAEWVNYGSVSGVFNELEEDTL